MHQHIKSWPVSQRPRERLHQEGAKHLSDTELLAILLSTGVAGSNALFLSQELLNKFGNLRSLFSVGSNKIVKIKGMGPAKAALILAAGELAKRQLREKVIGREVISEPEAVVDYLSYELRDQAREIFKVLFLSKANEVIEEKNLFYGTVDEASVYPREILRNALELNATSVILVHNHPSGRLTPSLQDKMITRKIQKACEILSVKVLDHIIIGRNGYTSFRAEGLLG